MDILDNQQEMTVFPKLAICIPTYNNPDYIKDILTEELPYYESNNMALYIMDASENDETQELACEYKIKFQNLYYRRYPSDSHSNKRVYMAFQMAGKEIPCDYMWIRSDATRASETLLNALPHYLAKGYDFIIVSYEGDYPKGIWDTSDPQIIFDEYCWRLCLYGASILKTRRMLQTADWAYLEKKYLCMKRINYSHMALYFEQMLRIENFHALIMGIPTILYRLTEKKKYSSWNRDIFKMWLINWPNAVEALPAIYERKLEAIRDFGVNVHYYYMPMLRELAAGGILTPKVYEEYRNRIIQYANMPVENFRDAAYGVPSERDGMGSWELFYYPRFMELFRSSYSTRFIYGCGKFAARCAGILNQYQIDFSAFIVSEKAEAQEKRVFMGHDVLAVDDIKFSNGCGIWLGLNEGNQQEILPFLREKGLLKYVFLLHGEYVQITNLVETVKKHALTKEMEDWT